MIRVYAPAINPNDLGKTQTRVGANFSVEEIGDNAKYILCVDGRCDTAADRVIKQLNNRGKKKILLLSHPHYDHYFGIEKDIDKYGDAYALVCQDPSSFNKNYSSEARGNVEALERIIGKAKKKGIRVMYARDNEKFKFGDIEFTTYRDQPSSARNTETYINQGSLSVWLSNIRVLYTGDTGAYCAEKYKLNPVVITGLHHGNWLSKAQAIYLVRNGCLYYWDDDYSNNITDFLSTGRAKAEEQGMEIFTLHGDLNIVCFSGKANIYKGGKTYSYKCSYTGKNTMKSATLEMVKNVLNGTAGGGDARTTYLLDKGYNPGSVQGWVNTFYKLIKE